MIRCIVQRVIEGEKGEVRGELSIVLVDDEFIHDLNRRFLKKDRSTDVIAFPFGEEEEGPWGEIYISEDRVKIQALEYHVPFQEELIRLIIHGVLHLLGYEDRTAESRKLMEKKENHYLEYISTP